MSGSPSAPETRWSVEGSRAWLCAAAVSFLTSLAILIPFFWLGTASGHDIQFHIQSWIDAAGQWKEGIVYPRWTEWANYGFGEPRFIFYPPLSWVLGAALGSVFPWTWIPGLFILTVQTFAGISTFALLRRLLGAFRIAVFGAAVFAANPYALVVIYMRSDFAELLASAFLPLLLLAALRLCGYLEDQAPRKVLVQFAVLFAAVWLSNAPAGVLATYGFALLFVWAALSQRTLQPGLAGAAAMTSGFAFACFYLIPAAYEQRWVNIAGALAGGLTPSDNFLFAHTKDVEHDAFNHIASYVAVALIAGMIAAAAAVRRQQSAQREQEIAKSTLWPAVFVLGAAASVMMLPVTNVFWTLLPKLRFVQFPWRWMGLLAVVFVIFLSASITRRMFLPVCVVTSLLLALSAFYLVKHTWWDTEDVNSVKEAVDTRVGFEGTDEYDPLGDDHTDIPQNQPEAKLIGPAESDAASKHALRVNRWTAEDRIITVRASQPSTLRLRLLHHPAWQVTVNGEPVKTSRTISYDAILVSVPAGESRIEAQFVRTADRTIGGCVSLFAVLAAGGILAWAPKRRAL